MGTQCLITINDSPVLSTVGEWDRARYQKLLARYGVPVVLGGFSKQDWVSRNGDDVGLVPAESVVVEYDLITQGLAVDTIDLASSPAVIKYISVDLDLEAVRRNALIEARSRGVVAEEGYLPEDVEKMRVKNALPDEIMTVITGYSKTCTAIYSAAKSAIEEATTIQAIKDILAGMVFDAPPVLDL
ncbi:MAG: hypothetical protein HQL54_12915 [Magnetococcales bacterium]|nr:hypothetical protein [Magnetococcales bacterium]